MGPLNAARSAGRSVDRLVDQTPPSRDRAVDFFRVAAVGVVVIWHWALSVTHRQDGELTMPNPVHMVPLGWLATWLLQVMPVFFVVGGYANLAAWDSVRRRGGGARAFLGRRLRRLLLPVAVFAAFWGLVEAAVRVLPGGDGGVWDTVAVVLVPLWFMAAYLLVVLLVPLTAAAHRRAGAVTAMALGGAVAVADLGRFGLGVERLGWVNTALVWVFAHQLGYFWRDGRLAASRRRWALVLGGLAALVVLTSLDAYPRSMVAVAGQADSNMYPTTAAIAAVAILQTGALTLLDAPVSRWLRRRRPWKAVVAANLVALTTFLWHMTALLVVILAWEAAGLRLPAEPTAGWWLQRPLWLIAPAPVLVLLIALFARFETATRR